MCIKNKPDNNLFLASFDVLIVYQQETYYKYLKCVGVCRICIAFITKITKDLFQVLLYNSTYKITLLKGRILWKEHSLL